MLSVENYRPLTGPDTSSLGIRWLLRNGHDFIEANILTDEGEFKSLDDLDGNKKLVSLYLEATQLEEDTITERKRIKANPILYRQTKTDFNTFVNSIFPFKKECEEKLLSFFKSPFKSRGIKESLIIMASYMVDLYNAKKLNDFIPGKDVKTYCKEVLFKKFQEVEKAYLFQYKYTPPVENDTAGQFIEYAWMQGDVCRALQDIEKIFAKEEEMTPQEAQKAATDLRLIAETCLIEEKSQPLFFDNLTRNASLQALHFHCKWMWRYSVNLYSIPMAKWLLPKMDSHACNIGLLFACGDNRDLELSMRSTRLEFIKLLLADKRTNLNVKQQEIKNFEEEIQGYYQDDTPLLLACEQPDSEIVRCLLDEPDVDPNVLSEDQPPLWYLFHEMWQDKDPEEIEKIMQLLVRDPQTKISAELLSHIEASPNVSLREAFRKEKPECFMASSIKEKEAEIDHRSKFNEMLAGFPPASSKAKQEEERNALLRKFSSLTPFYTSDPCEDETEVLTPEKEKKQYLKPSRSL